MSCQNTECVARLHNSIRYVFAASSTHDQFEINKMRKEVLCDGQMDLSFCVNQISGEGGGNAVVAPLAYFPPFTSPVHPPGNTGGITVYGQSSATLGRSLQDSKEVAALEGGGSQLAHLLYVKREWGQKWSSLSSLPSVHSPFTLTTQP